MFRMIVFLTVFVTTCLGTAFSRAEDLSRWIISGTILSSDKNPVIAANIKLYDNDSLVSWAVSDTAGKFSINAYNRPAKTNRLEISAIGYKSREYSISDNKDYSRFGVILTENPIDLGSIHVESKPDIVVGKNSLSGSKLIEKSRRSLILTNSAGAIKQPQAVRDGSAQSAKIRVNGTSPTYFINGCRMGDDPNHYGMFNIIASPNLSGLDFYAQGTPAKYESPSTIEFHTPKSFNRRFGGEFDFSFIEGTVLAAEGNDRYFVMTSIRKSFLDLFINKAPFKSDRLTIPPTSFTDFFTSSGIKLTPNDILIADHYYSKDYLSYDLSGSKRNPAGLNIAQNTEEQFVSIRLESTRPNFNYRIAASTKSGTESYGVLPATPSPDSNMLVDLYSTQRICTGDASFSYLLGRLIITAGNSTKYISDRKLNLHQSNWNFQPPDASSDNPYIYQPELNYLYGKIRLNDNQFDNASYVSLKSRPGKFEYELGMRRSYFQKLRTNWHTTYRGSIGYNAGRLGTLSLFGGTFAESPIKRILEPNQVFVVTQLDRLDPISSHLVSFSYTLSRLNMGVFTKAIHNIPILTPDFGRVDIENLRMEQDFLSMKSIGKLNSYGGDISIDLKNFPTPKWDICISYGYTHNIKSINELATPYELDAPHKLNIETDYRVSRVISIGGNLAAHSGYPYSQPVAGYQNYTLSRYTDEYYRGVLAGLNSSRFPVNYQSSIYANFDWGKRHLYLTIINVTNRKNPLISSADGYIYDNGILPSIGYGYQF
jgi:hypothetical protein